MPASIASVGMSSTAVRQRANHSRVRGLARGQRESAVAHDHGGHTVPARAGADPVPRHLRVHVGVTVDEAGRDDQPVGVDGALGRRPDATDLDDAAAPDADVAAIARGARAVDDRPAANQQIEKGRPLLDRQDPARAGRRHRRSAVAGQPADLLGRPVRRHELLQREPDERRLQEPADRRHQGGQRRRHLQLRPGPAEDRGLHAARGLADLGGPPLQEGRRDRLRRRRAVPGQGQLRGGRCCTRATARRSPSRSAARSASTRA